MLALQLLALSSFFWLFWSVLPRVAVGSGPPPPVCEWDASCQSVPGFWYPALGFFISAAAACIALAGVIMLWKCCFFCSGSRKEQKTERLSKLVEEKQMGSVSLQVSSWFAAAVMESCNGKLAALFRTAFVNDFVFKGGTFTVGSATDLARKTSSCFHLATFAIISNMDSSGGELLSGHVLGLRIEQAKVAVTFAFLFLLEALEGFHVFCAVLRLDRD